MPADSLRRTPADHAALVRGTLAWLKRRSTARNREGMARYGITSPRVFGVSMATMQPLARRLGRDQALAEALWATGWLEARVRAWRRRRGEFQRRAAFALLAALAVRDRAAPDARFREALPWLVNASRDNRPYVRKAVNWALRQIGKRNPALHRAACRTAESIRRLDTPSARWIAADALRELRNPQTVARITARGARDAARRR